MGRKLVTLSPRAVRHHIRLLPHHFLVAKKLQMQIERTRWQACALGALARHSGARGSLNVVDLCRNRNLVRIEILGFWTCVLGFGLVLTLLASAAHAADKTDATLYQSLGEKEGITRIVEDLLQGVHADPRTHDYFVDVSEKRLREKLIEQICQISDGPCQYTGRTMERAHEGLHITRAAFNALVEDLQIAMEKNDIPNRVQNRLLARLAPMVHQIEDR